ncbi:OmpA family protein [Marinibactrum halimedae]|uniref:OmpA family protein n=1 Tax=Marinibactrum halimedae TaxID=1444977 RepID=UPI0039F6B2FE
MKKLALVSAMAVAVGCTSIDPYTGQQKTSNTAKGAGIGAIAGAVLGAAANKDDRGKGALAGAVAGGAVGGGIGYYMDRQEAALRERLAGSGVQVQREGDNIRLVMPGNITFNTGQYNIRPQFYNVLDSVALVLVEFDQTAIKVAGHTDSTGSLSTNQTLSEQRAESVRGYLVNKQIKSGRIQAAGYGPRYPVASNSTSSGRSANRRVELELLPL